MLNTTRMFIRGRECMVVSLFNPPDRNTGDPGYTEVTNIWDANTTEVMVDWLHYGSDENDDPPHPAVLTEGEHWLVSRAIQESEPFNDYDHLVYSATEFLELEIPIGMPEELTVKWAGVGERYNGHPFDCECDECVLGPDPMGDWHGRNE